MKLDILAFGAHPDDIEIGVGGTLISEAEKGKSVGLIDFTQGEMGTRGTPEIRLKEAENAAKIMGAKMRVNLGLPDGLFQNDNDTKLMVIEQIRRYQPDIVITTAPSDRHPDHGRAAAIVVEACFLAGLQKLKDRSAQPAWRPRCVYQYMQFYQHQPAFIYDISEYIEKKLDAIRAHRSQFYDPDSSEPETLISSRHFFDNLTARASEYGIQAGFAYGEPLLTVRMPGLRQLDHLL